jgi:hypothetical protein
MYARMRAYVQDGVSFIIYLPTKELMNKRGLHDCGPAFTH